MSAFEHPDYKNELKRLEKTVGVLNNLNETIENEKALIDKSVEYSKAHYNADNTEQFNELVLNENRQFSLKSKLKNLKTSLDKPYFARVDFKEDLSSKVDNIYIGKMSLLDKETNEFLIVDWRSPVANLYYEGRIGRASYICPDGKTFGDISLKRQYIIEDSNLKDIFDIDITTNDDFLQIALGSNKDSRLKDIVSTIQSEQNKVIRADMWKPLIVQGAAGGGKTTIALHRIAYFMYNNENTLKPENFMIIAPNRFFLSYISDVLPELGVENVSQTTFEDLSFRIAKKHLDKSMKLKPAYEKLAYILEHEDEAFYITEASKFKSSLEFKDLLEKYIKYIEYNYIPKVDFKLYDTVLFSYKEIHKLFMKDYSHLPFSKRIDEITKSLINRISFRKDYILKDVEDEYEKKLNVIRKSMNDCKERREKLTSLIKERDEILLDIKKRSKTLVKNYIKNIPKRSITEYYKNFLDNLLILNKDNGKEDILKYLKDNSLQDIKNNLIEVEDLAPIIYITLKVYGLDEKLNLRHIIIDEAQDFSLFQLFALKQITNSGSFTILGDLCQGIYNYRGINDWNDVNKYIFKDEVCNNLCLEQSYRTTIEIMNTASNIISSLNDPRLPIAKPVIRHGEKVSVSEKSSLSEIANEIDKKIEFMLDSEYSSMAIICKTSNECKKLKSMLKNKKNVSMITGKENDYTGGIVIIPSYLAKGLEFDIVIIANASNEVYKKNDLDAKLLYVAMTRPLHKLYIYSLNQKSELIKID